MFYTKQLDTNKIQFELPIIKSDYSSIPLKYNYGTEEIPNYKELNILLEPKNVKTLGKNKLLLFPHHATDRLELFYDKCSTHIHQFNGAKLKPLISESGSGNYLSAPLKPTSNLYYTWPLPLGDLPIETYIDIGNLKIKPIIKFKSIYMDKQRTVITSELVIRTSKVLISKMDGITTTLCYYQLLINPNRRKLCTLNLLGKQTIIKID